MNTLTRNKILSFFIFLTLTLSVTAFLMQTLFSFIILLLSVSLLTLVVHDIRQTRHTLLRNYPLIGRLRWVFEHERSKIQQYFIEDDTNGTPFNREKRSDVYQKAKGDINTTPFGTQVDVYKDGYEFIKHSMYPKDINDVVEPRVTIGSKFCKHPYSASIFNISAMSYGALSDAAVMSLNGGAKLGNFYHNTGEGGLSPYHLQGGDLCFQIGTGYFGAGKTIDGKRYFDETTFLKTMNASTIKMVEIKLSQGAKPGHGGILPAAKNTSEIAQIRGVEQGTDVMSPPYHTAFTDSVSMINFISRIRTLTNGLPVGIKMCLGDNNEVEDLFKTMKEMDMYPDFITIDGGEGGTGAAPIVFTNNMGTPLIDSLVFIDKMLRIYGLREDIKIIASGKASTSFDIIKLVALGADVINAARAFMLSLGCIQARECNKNTCPVGIATQNRTLINGLNPAEKRVRVYNYHKSLIHELREVLGAMGVTDITKLTKDNIYFRVDKDKLITYKDLFN
jgi:glutamate synthase domain-containing protein 2